MSDSRLIKISKYLSKYLRHTPDAIGIELAPGGWVAVDELLTACAKNKFPISRQELELVVESSEKQRFSFDSTGTLIRANQGHSVEVDLQLEAVVPQYVVSGFY
jgi:putative RNA 2'-phosphotransferase